MATLRQKGKNYFIDYRIEGKRKRKSVGKSKKIAELALKDLEVKLALKENGFEVKDGSFSRLVSEYQKYCQTNISKSTQKRYGAIINNFKRFLSKNYPHLEKLSHFTPKIFEDFKAYRKSENAHNRTINAEMVVLRMMFRLAIQWGYTKDNPTDGVSRLKLPKKNAPRFLTEEECKKILESCDKWLYPIFYTFLSAGLRKSELEYLEWSDIDFDRRKIKIREKEGWSPKSNEREVPIGEGLLKVLQKQKRNANGSAYVFPDESGKQIHKNRLRKNLMSLTKQLGFPEVTKIHSLRHTFASHLVMKGVDLPTLKKLMGHSDIDTTMIYSHLTDEHVDNAVDKLDF